MVYHCSLRCQLSIIKSEEKCEEIWTLDQDWDTRIKGQDGIFLPERLF